MTNSNVKKKNLVAAYEKLVEVMGDKGPRYCRNALSKLVSIAAQYQGELSEQEQLSDEFKTIQDIYTFFDEVEHGPPLA